MVSIDFAYAQARVQARLGERLHEDGWRVLESSQGLSRYLASVRSTVLAGYVRRIQPGTTPHEIERALRAEWLDAVAGASRWIPGRWQAAIDWSAWVPYLDAVEHFDAGGAGFRWMRDDPVLSDLALDDRDARRLAIADSRFSVLLDGKPGTTWRQRWFDHWRTLWPTMDVDEVASLRELIEAVRDYVGTIDQQGTTMATRRDARARLVSRAIRIIHSRGQQPVIVFCHLLLVALDLQRLRDGLLRRALFAAKPGEAAA